MTAMADYFTWLCISCPAFAMALHCPNARNFILRAEFIDLKTNNQSDVYSSDVI